MDELHWLPATRLAERSREGALDPVELVDAHIKRIEAVNPELNAIVADRFAEARAEAIEARETLVTVRPEALPPLFGVPCTIKEFAALRGYPHTGAIVARREVRADRTAPVVQRLQSAGAIILGTTNAPEGGLWHETNNRIYGRTNNPWDLNRTCGGSSGGEAAIIAAGGSPFGLGSDVGGSVRIPAAFCGIASHKPTGRRVPSTGHFPPAPHMGDFVSLSFGPMTRSVRDLWPLLQILAGPDGEDPFVERGVSGDPNDVDWSEVTVYPLPSNGRSRPTAEVVAGVERSARILADRGATIREIDPELFRRGFEMWAGILSQDELTYEGLVGRGGRVNRLRELGRYALGRSDHTGPVLFMLLVEKLLERMPDSTTEMMDLCRQLQQSLEALLGPRGLILHPTFTRDAPRHRAIIGSLFDPAHTALFNVLEFPATQVPMGRSARGLPLGLQVVGVRGADALTIAGAQVLEDSRPAWRPISPRRVPTRLRFVRS